MIILYLLFNLLCIYPLHWQQSCYCHHNCLELWTYCADIPTSPGTPFVYPSLQTQTAWQSGLCNDFNGCAWILYIGFLHPLCLQHHALYKGGVFWTSRIAFWDKVQFWTLLQLPLRYQYVPRATTFNQYLHLNRLSTKSPWQQENVDQTSNLSMYFKTKVNRQQDCFSEGKKYLIHPKTHFIQNLEMYTYPYIPLQKTTTITTTAATLFKELDSSHRSSEHVTRHRSQVTGHRSRTNTRGQLHRGSEEVVGRRERWVWAEGKWEPGLEDRLFLKLLQGPQCSGAQGGRGHDIFTYWLVSGYGDGGNGRASGSTSNSATHLNTRGQRGLMDRSPPPTPEQK